MRNRLRLRKIKKDCVKQSFLFFISFLLTLFCKKFNLPPRMKYFTIYISLLFSLVFIACTNDDTSNRTSSQDFVLVSSLTKQTANTTYTTSFEYTDYKLNKVVYAIDNSYDLYTYTEDLITKIEHFNAEGIITETSIFEYNSNKDLVKETSEEIRDNELLTFNYNYTYLDSKTIKVNFTSIAENGITYDFEKIINLKDQEILNTVYTLNNYTTTFEYDVAKNPFKNIDGFKKLYISEYFGEKGNFRNVVSKSYGNKKTENFYRYNVDNYPTEVIEKNYENNILKDTEIITFEYVQ